jgi:hypothetical protein
MITLDVSTILIAATGVFLISFMKGVFGGGLALLGIPLLSLVMPPLVAGALLAPLFIVMDIFALRYWKPSTWSKPDAIWLVPALLVGTVIGYIFLVRVDAHLVAIFIAILILIFTGHWFWRGANVTQRPRSAIWATIAGAGSGFTSMVAHAGGPPVAMYLLPLGLPRAVYAGTTSLVFSVGNIAKVVPWLFVASIGRPGWLLMAILVPVVPIGVWVGWTLHTHLSDRRLYIFCYSLLVVVAVKLLWSGLTEYF